MRYKSGKFIVGLYFSTVLFLISGDHVSGEDFPPNWEVGDTWKTKLINIDRSIRSEKDAPPVKREFIKTYEIIKKTEEEVGQEKKITLFVVKVTAKGEDPYFRVKVREKNMILSRWELMTGGRSVSSDINKENDTYIDTSKQLTFTLPKFPDPNKDEKRVIYDNERSKLVHDINFDGDKCNVVVKWVYKGNNSQEKVTQTWEKGKPWPVKQKLTTHVPGQETFLSYKEKLVEVNGKKVK